MPLTKEESARLDAFRDASMACEAIYNSLAKACGLSGPEYWSLVLIHEGIVTQGEISRQLCLNRQTLNSAFKLLIRKGLIRLEPLPQDQRSKQAILTQAGETFVREHIVRMEDLEAQAWQALSPEEQTDLTRLTLRFNAAMTAALEHDKMDNDSSEDPSSQ